VKQNRISAMGLLNDITLSVVDFSQRSDAHGHDLLATNQLPTQNLTLRDEAHIDAWT